jgi:hypothetical protein
VEQIDARYTGIRGTKADFSVAARDLGFPVVTGLAYRPSPGGGTGRLRRFRKVQPSCTAAGCSSSYGTRSLYSQRGVSEASRDAERLRESLDRSLARGV